MPPYRLTAAELERARSRLLTPYVRPPPLFYNEDDDLSYLDQPTLGIRPNLEHQAELQADAREETMLWRAEEEREVADLRRHAEIAAGFQREPTPPFYELPPQDYVDAAVEQMRQQDERRERGMRERDELLRQRNNFLRERADQRAREREERQFIHDRELDRRRRRAQRIIRDDILPPYRDDDMYDQMDRIDRVNARNQLLNDRGFENEEEFIRFNAIYAWENVNAANNGDDDTELPPDEDFNLPILRWARMRRFRD